MGGTFVAKGVGGLFATGVIRDGYCGGLNWVWANVAVWERCGWIT